MYLIVNWDNICTCTIELFLYSVFSFVTRKDFFIVDSGFYT